MATLVFNQKEFEINEDGYLKSFDQWTEEFSYGMAKQEGVEDLTEDHWRVIHYVRDYYTRNGIAPMVLKLQRALGISIWRLRELFPTTSERAICKISGLPKPTGCI
ncbi:MAG: TusE/DsrC/DsvC family sulfur relay protein [Pseudomonadota bacterium]